MKCNRGGERYTKTYQKRPDYAIRAMAQTRAISRACRSAFAHVVVMIDASLSTTPAEEVPDHGFDDAPAAPPRNVTPARQTSRPAAAPDFPGDAPPEPAKAAQPTLGERTDAFLTQARACTTVEALNALCRSNVSAKLDDDLDKHDPDARATVNDEINALFDALEAKEAA